MTQIPKLLLASCFVLTFAFTIQVDAPRLEAQIVSTCGCGKSTCSGCLKGKLFPVKQLSQKIKPKKSCDCAACSVQEVQPAGAAQSVVTSDLLISSEYVMGGVSAPVATACGCGESGCRSCKLKRVRKVRTPLTRSCPQCDCDFCELKVSKTKDKKKCFEVKQKEVCIPPVRLPWKKCCPPTKAKVRVVNVLKSKTYECPGCKYEWKVHEPEVPKSASESSKSSDGVTEEAPVEVAPIKEVDPAAPKMNVPDVDKLDLETVPQPPVEKI